jgi:hypothetical protein
MEQLLINVLMELVMFLQSTAIVREPFAGMVLAKITFKNVLFFPLVPKNILEDVPIVNAMSTRAPV